jgi:hypothetical protein
VLLKASFHFLKSRWEFIKTESYCLVCFFVFQLL